MEPPLPMILPKGIVRNTDAIYAALASFSVVPPEILWGCWHVYTYTSRRLNDPTAHRLENFWWHVLGSDRRHLSGKALAKIYEEISNGPTFVPLKGPVNRYEGPPVPRFSQHELDKMLSGPDLGPRQSRAQGQGRNTGSPTKVGAKEPTSSSTRPPPLHPILKSTRGPSSSGPRPTARFVSPPDSGEESGGEEEDVSSGSTAALEMRPQLPPPAARTEKKATQATKKFVATTSAHKRRPVLPRRPSSQSSTASEPGSKEGASGSSTKHVSTSRLSPSIAEQSAKIPDRSPGSSTLAVPPVLSAKAAGKQPAKAVSGKETSRDRPSHKVGQGRIVIEQQQATMAQERPASGSSDSTEYETARARDGPRRPSPVPITSEKMVRSHSNQSQQSSAGRQPPSGLAASSVSATSTVAVQGQFDFDSPSPAAASLEPRDIPDQVARRSSKPLFTPTQPSPTPDVPLARSKSQLAVLLELDKDRSRSRSHQGQNGSNGKQKVEGEKEQGKGKPH
ncbi:hypothetical protein QBC33DRAFT_356321 [Phialemonium atrogriseum]|uniref:Nitrogen regulatory protein areA GATA-like domain-containing protein n=1 Tax=Phialemonium atrogriseum TaxID=1093897 RepID=A0AAJ0C394_9PEZI|nr:uncharacterized protein QBC33DRAFT_356321 [Phialemonium atrogriseum]KAK1768707.1 hypothetical protein QBC33DRAFT_356321 [Phialemonium atrogriseum]